MQTPILEQDGPEPGPSPHPDLLGLNDEPTEPAVTEVRSGGGGRVLLIALVAALAGLGLLGVVPSSRPGDGAAATGPGSAPGSAAEPIGGAAPPPLPISPPTASGYHPTSAIANHDGSVVAELTEGTLTITDRGQRVVVAGTTFGQDDELRAVSADGTKAAVFRHEGGASEITVVDTTGATDPRRYEFGGMVEPEAFSTDGEQLFVIDHQVAAAPGSYRVRPLDLETGQLETIVGPSKLPIEEDMNGVGRRQVWANDGQRLYTLYIRQTHHHHEPGDGTAPHRHGEPGTDGFVHVLDLREEWAFCLDLPPAFGGGDLDGTALAVRKTSQGVDELAVIDLAAGAVAFADTDALVVTSTVAVPELAVDDRIHLALFERQLAVGSGDRVTWLTRPDLEPYAEHTVDGELFGFTSFDETLLAWPTAFDRGPTQLRPPTPT